MPSQAAEEDGSQGKERYGYNVSSSLISSTSPDLYPSFGTKAKSDSESNVLSLGTSEANSFCLNMVLPWGGICHKKNSCGSAEFSGRKHGEAPSATDAKRSIEIGVVKHEWITTVKKLWLWDFFFGSERDCSKASL